MANDLISLSLKISFQSDFHIGSGLGITGVADSLIMKDTYGIPYIPGSTIKALLRDSSELILDFLGIDRCDGTLEQTAGNAQGKLCGVNPPSSSFCSICHIFGSPFAPPKFAFRTARYEESLYSLLQQQKMKATLRQLSREETHNKIDRWTGTAEEDFLFTLELGSQRFPFSSSIDQLEPMDNSLREKLLPLLVAAISFTRNVGGKRRRGKGKCKIEIVSNVLGKSPSDWINQLGSLGVPQ